MTSPRLHEPPHALAAPPIAAADHAWHIICIGRVRDLRAFSAGGIEPGLDARVLPAGDLAAVVAPTPRHLVEHEAGEQNLSDLAWIAPRAQRHHEIVRSAMRHGPIAPVRFGTLVSDPQRVLDLLADRGGPITEALGRLEGREELGVRIGAQLDQLAEQRAAALVAQHDAEASGGRSYLLRRKLHDRAVREVRAEAAAAAQQALDALAALAHAREDRPAGARRDDGLTELARAAILVDAGALEHLRRHADQLAADHLRIELTGPWPPYSFCAGVLGEAAPC